MQFLLDQGLPRTTVAELRKRGIEAKHVGELNLSTAADRDIIAMARQLKTTIVTLDADFHTLLASENATEPSVIRIRIEGLKGEDLAKIVAEVLKSSETDLKQGAAVSVTQSSIRIKMLPLI